MAVQIPRLQRIAPQAPESVGRIETKLPDISNAGASFSKALTDSGKAIDEHVYEVEKQAAELDATKGANDYEVAYKTEKEKLKGIDGNPTEAYSKFDQDSQKWMNDIRDKYKGSSELVKQRLEAKLQSTHESLRVARSVDEAVQYNAYEKKTTDSTISLAKEGAISALEIYNVNDPDTILPFTEQIARMKDTRVASGERTGLVTRDAKGERVYSASLDMQMKKDVSDTIKDAVEILNAKGMIAESESLMERYKDDILADTKSSLAKSTKSSLERTEALNLASTLYGFPPDVQLKKLDEMTNLSPAIKDKARKALDTHARIYENAKRRASDSSFEEVAQYLRKKEEGGNPLLTVDQLENDPVFNRAANRMTDAKRKALYKLVEAPAKSDPITLEKMYESVNNRELRGMSMADFEENVAGLTKTDKNKFRKMWENSNLETESEESRRISFTGKELKEQMIAAKLLKPNQYGKLTTKDRIKYTQAMDAMTVAMEDLKGAGPAEQRKWVKDYTVRVLKDGIKEPVTTTEKIESTVRTRTVPKNAPAKMDIAKESAAYAAAKKGAPPSLKALKEWVANGRPQ
jgi:hypothetical protein